MISVLVPTRNASVQFESLIHSLSTQCEDKSMIEILVKVDDDTTDSRYANYIPKCWGFKNYRVLSSPRGRGYLDLNNYLHSLARVAQGSIFWLIMDDMIVEGDWANAILSTRDRVPDNIFLAYSHYACSSVKWRDKKFRTTGNANPVVSREMYEKLGHFGVEGVSFDSYLRQVAGLLPNRTFLLDIKTAQMFRSRAGVDKKVVKKKLGKQYYIDLLKNAGIVDFPVSVAYTT